MMKLEQSRNNNRQHIAFLLGTNLLIRIAGQQRTRMHGLYRKSNQNLTSQKKALDTLLLLNIKALK